MMDINLPYFDAVGWVGAKRASSLSKVVPTIPKSSLSDGRNNPD